jgi:predicted DsbA family dithiol-disulfide isomerase
MLPEEKNMATMQIFFDYECPYCKKGYEYLMEYIGGHGEIELEGRPVEAHPRPENHPPHTDLCCQAYYIARELKANLPKFFAAMFQAVAIERRDVEKVDVLVDIVKDIVDGAKFRAILESRKYARQVDENNDLAYEKSGVWFVPAFRMNRTDGSEKKLDAQGGLGVTREQVKAFLEQA